MWTSILRPFVKSGLLIGWEIHAEVKFDKKVEVRFRSK